MFGADLSNGGRWELPSLRPGEAVDFSLHPFRRIADFDGDDRSDVFVLSDPRDHMDGWLTSDGFDPVVLSSPSLTTDMVGQVLETGDVDGDGRDDLIQAVYETTSEGETFLRLDLLYGFRPLWRPSVRVIGRTPAGAGATLALAVEGDPVEMRLGGDIDDSRRDHWVPYRPSVTTAVSSGPGPKTITVAFRNGRGRESERAAITLSAVSPGTGLTVLRSQATAESPAMWEVSTEGGGFRATVYDVDGRRVRRLEDGEYPAGAQILRWDGRNDAGRRVAAGVYVVVVEAGSVMHRRRILVR
jgi:hypothetical protein